jgi:hypothetical protein
MPKYRVFISERLIHTHLVEAENREALADMIGDMEEPIQTEMMAYEYLPEHTEEVEEVMETYLIAEVLNTGDWGIIEEFAAQDDEAANAYADEHYSHIEWYVLYQSTQVNING